MRPSSKLSSTLVTRAEQPTSLSPSSDSQTIPNSLSPSMHSPIICL